MNFEKYKCYTINIFKKIQRVYGVQFSAFTILIVCCFCVTVLKRGSHMILLLFVCS